MANVSNLFPTNNNAPANATPIDLNNLLQQLGSLGYDANALGQSFKNVQNNTNQFNTHLQNSIRLQQESVSEARKQNNSIDDINASTSRVQPTQTSINNNSHNFNNNNNISQPRNIISTWEASTPRSIRNNEYISTKSSNRPVLGGDAGRMIGDDLNKNLQQFGHMINPASFAQYAIMFGASFPAQMAMAGAAISPVTDTVAQFDKIKSFSGGITGVKDAVEGFGQHLQQSPFKMYEGMYQSKIMLSSSLGGEKQSNEAVKTALKLAKEYPVRSDQVLSSLTRLSVYPEVKPNLKDEGFQRKLMETVSGLSLIVPEQGMEGAMFSLVEAMSGSLRSMQMRFNVSPEVVESMAGMSKQEMSSDPNKLVSGLHSFVSKAVGLDVLDKQKYTFSKQVDNFGDSLQMLVKEVFESTGLYKTITGGATAFQTGFSSLATNKEFLNFTGTITKPFQGKTDAAMSKFTGIPLGLYQSSSIGDMSKMAEENFKNLSMDEIDDRFGNLINDMGGALREVTKSINGILNKQFGTTLGEIASDLGDVAVTNFTQMASGVIAAATKNLVTDPTMLMAGAGMMATVGMPMFVMQIGTGMLQQSLQKRPISQRISKGMNSIFGYDDIADKMDDMQAKSNAYNSTTGGGGGNSGHGNAGRFDANLNGKQLHSTMATFNEKSISALATERSNFMIESDVKPKRLRSFVNNSIRGSKYSSLVQGDDIFNTANPNSQATIKAMMGDDFKKFQDAGFTDNQIYKMQTDRLATTAHGMKRDIYESTGEKLSTKQHGAKFVDNATKMEYNYGVSDKLNSTIKRSYGKDLNALGETFTGSDIEKQIKNNIATRDRFENASKGKGKGKYTNFAPDMEGGGYSIKKANEMQTFLKGEIFGEDTDVIRKLNATPEGRNAVKKLGSVHNFNPQETAAIFDVADTDAGLAKFLAENNIVKNGYGLAGGNSTKVRTYINKMGVKNPELLNAITGATGRNEGQVYAQLSSKIKNTNTGADYAILHALDAHTEALRATMGQVSASETGGTVTKRSTATAFFDQRSPNKQLTDLINATKNNAGLAKLVKGTDIGVAPSVRASKLQSSALYNNIDKLTGVDVEIKLPPEFGSTKLANDGKTFNLVDDMLKNQDYIDVYTPKATMSRAEKYAQLANDVTPEGVGRMNAFRAAEEIDMVISHGGSNISKIFNKMFHPLTPSGGVGSATDANRAVMQALHGTGGDVAKFKVGSAGNVMASTNEFVMSIKNTSSTLGKFGKVLGGALSLVDIPLLGMMAYSTAKEGGLTDTQSKIIGAGTSVGTIGAMYGLSGGKGLMHGATKFMPYGMAAYSALDMLQGNLEGKNKIKKKEDDVDFRQRAGEFGDVDMSAFTSLNSNTTDRQKTGIVGMKDGWVSTAMMMAGGAVAGAVAGATPTLGIGAIPGALIGATVAGGASLYANYQRGRGEYSEQEKETLGNISGFSAQSKMYKERSVAKQREIDAIEGNSFGNLPPAENNKLIALKRSKLVDDELRGVTSTAAGLAANIGNTKATNIEAKWGEQYGADTLIPSDRTMANFEKWTHPGYLAQRGANAAMRGVWGNEAFQFEIGNMFGAPMPPGTKDTINPLTYIEDKGATSASRLLNYTDSDAVKNMSPQAKLPAYIASSAYLTTVNKEFRDDLSTYSGKGIGIDEKNAGMDTRIYNNKVVNDSVRTLQRESILGIDFNDTEKVEMMKQTATSMYSTAPIPIGNQAAMAKYKEKNVGTLIQDNIEAQLLSSVATNDNMRNYYSAIDTGSAANLSQMGIDNPIDLISKTEERQKYIKQRAQDTYSKNANGEDIENEERIKLATNDFNNVFKSTLSALGSVGTPEGNTQIAKLEQKNANISKVFESSKGSLQGGAENEIGFNIVKQSSAIKSIKGLSEKGDNNKLINNINAALPEDSKKITDIGGVEKLSDNDILSLTSNDNFMKSLNGDVAVAFKALAESTVKLNAVFSKSAQSTSQSVAQSSENIQKFGDMLRIGAISTDEYNQNVAASKADANNSINALKKSGETSQLEASTNFNSVASNSDIAAKMKTAGINSAEDLSRVDANGKSGLERLKGLEGDMFNNPTIAKDLEEAYAKSKIGKSDKAAANYENYQLKMDDAKHQISQTSAGSQYAGSAIKMAGGSWKNKDRLIKSATSNLKDGYNELLAATNVEQYDAAKLKIDTQNSMLDQLGVNDIKRSAAIGHNLYQEGATSMADADIYGNKFTDRGKANAAAAEIASNSNFNNQRVDNNTKQNKTFKDEASGKYYDYEGATYANAHKRTTTPDNFNVQEKDFLGNYTMRNIKLEDLTHNEKGEYFENGHKLSDGVVTQLTKKVSDANKEIAAPPIDIPQNIKDDFNQRTKGKVTDEYIIKGEAPGKLSTEDAKGAANPADKGAVTPADKGAVTPADRGAVTPPQNIQNGAAGATCIPICSGATNGAGANPPPVGAANPADKGAKTPTPPAGAETPTPPAGAANPATNSAGATLPLTGTATDNKTFKDEASGKYYDYEGATYANAHKRTTPPDNFDVRDNNFLSNTGVQTRNRNIKLEDLTYNKKGEYFENGHKLSDDIVTQLKTQVSDANKEIAAPPIDIPQNIKDDFNQRTKGKVTDESDSKIGHIGAGVTAATVVNNLTTPAMPRGEQIGNNDMSYVTPITIPVDDSNISSQSPPAVTPPAVDDSNISSQLLPEGATPVIRKYIGENVGPMGTSSVIRYPDLDQPVTPQVNSGTGFKPPIPNVSPSNIVTTSINRNASDFAQGVNSLYKGIGNSAHSGNVSLLNSVNVDHKASQQTNNPIGILAPPNADTDSVGGHNATANQGPADFVRNLMADILPAWVGNMQLPLTSHEPNFTTNGM